MLGRCLAALDAFLTWVAIRLGQANTVALECGKLPVVRDASTITRRAYAVVETACQSMEMRALTELAR